MKMEKYKEDFIKFLVKCNSLKFGEFKLKSGRIAPYFLNTGMFSNGEQITKLGEYYAAAIKKEFGMRSVAPASPAMAGNVQSKSLMACSSSGVACGRPKVNPSLRICTIIMPHISHTEKASSKAGIELHRFRLATGLPVDSQN